MRKFKYFKHEKEQETFEETSMEEALLSVLRFHGLEVEEVFDENN